MTHRGVVAGCVAIGMVLVVVLALLVGLDRNDARDRTIAPSSTTTTRPVLVSPTSVVAPPVTTPTTVPPAASTGRPTAPPRGTVVVNPPLTTPATTSPPSTSAPGTTASSAGSTSTTVVTSQPTTAARSPGATAERLTLAVIVDGTTAPGMRAWATEVNERGGIAGRKVALDVLSVGHDPNRYRAAVVRACERDFAIVGSTSTAADGGVDAAACGTPDLPIRAASPVAATTFPVVPEDPAKRLVGAVAWLVDHVDDCCRGVVLTPPGAASQLEALARVRAAEAVGYRTADEDVLSVASGPSAVGNALRTSGADLVWTMLRGADTVALRRALGPQATAPAPIWLCGSACYSGAFLASGGAAVEGQYVEVEVNPFEDAPIVPGLREYLLAMSELGAAPSVAGLQQFAAGLLFQEAAEAGRKPLSRAAVLEALSNMHAFNARGILGPTDIGQRRANGCFVLLQVRSARYERIEPKAPGELACGPWNLRSVSTPK